MLVFLWLRSGQFKFMVLAPQNNIADVTQYVIDESIRLGVNCMQEAVTLERFFDLLPSMPSMFTE